MPPNSATENRQPQNTNRSENTRNIIKHPDSKSTTVYLKEKPQTGQSNYKDSKYRPNSIKKKIITNSLISISL
jgi:hypothetical protein